LALLIIGFIIFVFAAWDKRFDSPMPDFKASKDSAIIARGKYLAYGPAHCATCHVPPTRFGDTEKGMQIPLSGGWEINIPPGTFRAPNLTPDMETGIGKLTDGQIARALRHSVRDNGRILFPFMPFQNMCDDDVIAVISFLRSQEPVSHYVEPSKYKFLGKALLAIGAMTPVEPNGTPYKSVNKDSSAIYGSYLANSVANCVGCHTQRDLKTGKFTGKPFAGGMQIPGGADSLSLGFGFMTPNLTPDEETGVMAQWNESSFINRFRAGRVHKGSPMPWGTFARMDDLDLKALYRYLHSLKPVKNKISKTVFKPGEEFPELVSQMN
jgi:mono/diheme cytochrome c family protein